MWLKRTQNEASLHFSKRYEHTLGLEKEVRYIPSRSKQESAHNVLSQRRLEETKTLRTLEDTY